MKRTRMSEPEDTGEALEDLKKRIVACERCPRLVSYRQQVAKVKRKKFLDWDYWGRPVPGFGSNEARLIVLGLAPAAHGGNRTGRVFTGDPSAQFLMSHLHEAGFANHPYSLSRGDGLELKETYVTAVVKCVPPGNKPTALETLNCAGYLAKEQRLLHSAHVVLLLGRFAFDAYKRMLADHFGLDTSKMRFKHGGVYHLGGEYPSLYASYHPSPHNTNTGKLTSAMFRDVLKRIRREIYQRHQSRVGE